MEGFGELMAVEQERLDQLTGALEAARRVEVELEAQHNAHAFVAAMDRATLARGEHARPAERRRKYC